MGWIKRRPEIELFTRARVLAGETFQVRVVLHCAEALAVNGVELIVRGAFVSRSDHEFETEFMRAAIRLQEAGELAAGAHAFVRELALAPTSPPSYEGARLRVEYTLQVEVDIPWWPDARAAYHLRVIGRGEERPALAPLYASPIAEPPGSAPHVEVSLASDALRPGGVIEGAAALLHADPAAVRGMHAALVAIERSYHLGSHARTLFRWPLPGDTDLADGRPRRFRLSIPASVVPGFELAECGLAWNFEVHVDLARGRDPACRIPVKILADEADEGGEERATPAVGSERQALIWRRVGERTGLDEAGGALSGRVGAVSLQIARERRPGGGAVIVAAIEAPDLAIGLGLAGEGGGLRSRDMSQATWLEEQLAGARGDQRWSAAADEGLRLELRDAGRDASALAAFAERALAIARRLDAIRDDLPPPRALAPQRARWAEAAARLGARLRPGDLAILGRTGDLEVAVTCEWDHRGEVLRTSFEARPALPISERHHLAWCSLDGDLPASELPLAAVAEGAWRLEIDRAAIRVVITGGVDPLRELGRVRALQGLAERLAGRLGVYR